MRSISKFFPQFQVFFHADRENGFPQISKMFPADLADLRRLFYKMASIGRRRLIPMAIGTMRSLRKSSAKICEICGKPSRAPAAVPSEIILRKSV